MTEHRVPLLRRYEDPTQSTDPQIRDVLAALATLEVAPPPRAHFRAELRAQLVAVAPRIVAESAEELAAAKAARPSPTRAVAHRDGVVARPSFGARLRAIPIGRPLMVAASVIAVLALVLGGAVWMSRKALPGDALYGLKRASEDAQLALDSNDSERARDYLDFAATRVNEAKALVGRTSASGAGVSASGVSKETAGYIDSTLSAADSDVRSAARLLGDQAVRSASGSSLDPMTSWAPGQLTRLTQLWTSMPAGPLRERAASSRLLVGEALDRAKTLQATVACHCLTPGSGDSLGPLPARIVKPTPVSPAPRRTTPHTGGQASTGGTTTAAPGGTGNGNGTTGSGPTPPRTSPRRILPSVPVSLPTQLPTSLPTAPISVGKSCVSASILIGVKLGSCPSK